MSREIKFRAWDKESRGWIYSKPMPDMAFWKWVQYDSTTVFNESTGLKDKNGMEIYEGDIIAEYIGDYNGNSATVANSQFLVKWEHYGFNIDDNDYIILGNIYQNPELLKGL